MGDYNSLCDICGFKFKASELKKDWQGLYLCPDDYQARHPQDFLKGVKDNPSIPWSRPDTGMTECGPSSVPGQAIPGCAVPGYSKDYISPL